MFSNQRKCLTEDEVLDILYNDDSGDDLIPELDSTSDNEAYRTDIILLHIYNLFLREQLIKFITPMAHKMFAYTCIIMSYMCIYSDKGRVIIQSTKAKTTTQYIESPAIISWYSEIKK
ncbi:hypothetical protein C0J52_28229 [Blattella germanica]|nr:hypothetical protein C0J52_28229 [Blattella germanica]